MLTKILEELYYHSTSDEAIAHAKSEIEKCVPEKQDVDCIVNGVKVSFPEIYGWNACREEMLKRMEGR